MTDTSLSDRLRARADYLGTIMSGDPPVQLDAESPLLLRAAANTIDYLAPFQAALRLLGFGDEYCTSTDPIDYAKRWLAERLREDTARADAERRLAKIEVELGHVRARSSILKGRKRSDFVRLDAPIASAVNIREPVDVAAQLTNMLETALQEAKALQAILDRGNS